MVQANWEADKMLDVYIHDYFLKRNLLASAKAFQAEGKVSSDPVAIDAPGGFLFEWWSVFWDIFISRTKEKHSEAAASYIETQQLKAREQQIHLQLLQRQTHHQQQQQQQQQQVRREMAMHNGLGAETLLRQGTANALATKIYEDRLKHAPPQQRDLMEETSMKRYGEFPNQLLEANHSALLKAAAASTPGQASGPFQSGNIPNALQQVQACNQVPGTSQESKPDVSAVLNKRSPATDPSMFGMPVGMGPSKPNLLSPGVNQGANNLPLKGWSLTGLDQLRPGLVQSQKPLQSPQQYQLHMLGNNQQQQQQQQQIMMPGQAHGNMSAVGSPLLNDTDEKRLQILRTMALKEGQFNGSADSSQGLLSPMQGAGSIPRDEIFMKIKLAQLQHQQQGINHIQQAQAQQLQIHSQPQPTGSQQERLMNAGGGVALLDGSISNSFHCNNDQSGLKGQNGRKRKQPGSSSGPANSTGTGNTATGPSPNSAPSTPSTHTPGDVMPTLAGGSSKSLMMFGSDGPGGLGSPSNHLMQADIDRFGEDGSLDDNVDSFLSHEEVDPRESLFSTCKRSPAGHNMDTSKRFSFAEFGSIRASNNKVIACHFSSDGKLLATAGHDKRAALWNMDTLKLKSTLEEHSSLITDVRFGPNSTRLATSSFDRTVRVWDADNPSFSVRSFTGHSTSILSLDFHPKNEDLLCSCDDNEIRFWSVNQGVCTRSLKGGMTQVRFQPRHGRLLASASENVVSIFDMEADTWIHTLQGHLNKINSVCWDATGDFVASVSEDSVRVWSLRSGSDGECVHELSCNGNKFHSCVFHPNYSALLIIGCYQSLELWNMVENKSMTVPAHEGLIASLAQSPANGMVASASHDKCVKLWK